MKILYRFLRVGSHSEPKKIGYYFGVAQSFCFKARPKCEALDMKMIFYSQEKKTHFYKKGFALNLVWTCEFFQLVNGVIIIKIMEFI